MSPTKERPILFSAPMVRAILEGRKTVTRREVKKQAALDCLATGFEPAFLALLGNADLCPYGQPGDRLWVRETWQDVHPVQVIDRYSQLGRAGIPGPPGVTYQTIYRADGEYSKVHYTHEHPYRCIEPDPNHGFLGAADSGWTGWTTSIHMPRWASRTLLEITEDQAKAEGVCISAVESFQATGVDRSAGFAFRDLWTSISGDENWNANPWVWVIEFKKIGIF